MAVVLIIKTEDGQTAELAIIDKITLGRSSSTDFKIADAKMSSQHCSISITKKGEVLFEDLGSTNGSFMNNSKIHHAIVKVNDVLRVGNTLIKIDPKKLTPKERQTVGVSSTTYVEEKTLPKLTASQLDKIKQSEKEKDIDEDKAAENAPKSAQKKPTVILNKDLVKKKPAAQGWVKPNENVIEQEESSGMTKMLKLDKIISKKKK